MILYQKKIVIVLLCLILLVMYYQDTVEHATNTSLLPDGVYRIKHHVNVKYLKINKNDILASGSKQTDATKWRFRSVDDISNRSTPNVYTIQSDDSDLYLDAHYDSNDERTVMKPKQNNWTQQWVVRKNTNGKYTIRQNSKSNRMLDAYESGTRAVVVRGVQDDSSQMWDIERVKSGGDDDDDEDDDGDDDGDDDEDGEDDDGDDGEDDDGDDDKIDCRGEWNKSKCEDGERTKTYRVTRTAKNGGEECLYDDNYKKEEDCTEKKKARCTIL